jgi:hypothetical protein
MCLLFLVSVVAFSVVAFSFEANHIKQVKEET